MTYKTYMVRIDMPPDEEIPDLLLQFSSELKSIGTTARERRTMYRMIYRQMRDEVRVICESKQ